MPLSVPLPFFLVCDSFIPAEQGSTNDSSMAQSAGAADVVDNVADSSTKPVTFADEDLEIAVRREIDKPERDIFGSDLETIESLFLANKEID